MNTLGKRITAVRGSESRESFAAKYEIHRHTLAKWEEDSIKPSDIILYKMAKDYDVPTEWLLSGFVTSSTVSKEFSESEFESIPLESAVLSAGGGSMETEKDILESYAFRKDWIRSKGNPKNMILMRVAGDSMAPKIEHDDIVLIDKGKNQFVPYGIFAIRVEDAIYVKELMKEVGKLVLHSLNSSHADTLIDLTAEQGDSWEIIGRVLWVGKELD